MIITTYVTMQFLLWKKSIDQEEVFIILEQVLEYDLM